MAELDVDKLLAACQEAVSNPAAASKTSTEALLVNPLAAIPKTPPDEAPPPWRAPRSTATAAKVSRKPAIVRDPRLGPRQPSTVPDPRLAIASKSKPLSSGSREKLDRRDRCETPEIVNSIQQQILADDN